MSALLPVEYERGDYRVTRSRMGQYVVTHNQRFGITFEYKDFKLARSWVETSIMNEFPRTFGSLSWNESYRLGQFNKAKITYNPCERSWPGAYLLEVTGEKKRYFKFPDLAYRALAEEAKDYGMDWTVRPRSNYGEM